MARKNKNQGRNDGMEIKKTIQRVNDSKSWLSEEINKMDRSSAPLKGRGTEVRVRDEHMTTDTKEARNTMRTL